MALTKESVMKALRKVTDPEMHLNIVDLGLVYEVKIDKRMVIVDMTLTSPACPVGPFILDAVDRSVRGLKEVEGVTVNIVWNPPWSIERVSEEGKMELGII